MGGGWQCVVRLCDATEAAPRRDGPASNHAEVLASVPRHHKPAQHSTHGSTHRCWLRKQCTITVSIPRQNRDTMRSARTSSSNVSATAGKAGGGAEVVVGGGRRAGGRETTASQRRRRQCQGKTAALRRTYVDCAFDVPAGKVSIPHIDHAHALPVGTDAGHRQEQRRRSAPAEPPLPPSAIRELARLCCSCWAPGTGNKRPWAGASPLVANRATCPAPGCS